ncbi:hypothetical protein M446_4469 [Methylobacterium sp. 4-46]|uniref:hypothetical protein n=1 Tax=unclassified Methylobacterium TaxID=2615210 RepID=UPI000152CCC1|nr:MULTISPECIES: hypothetical protein [Methylobacterium]ACA18810.1 hypothetical protein M446_4469 [Methylobacterium sp. 4-46]WFT78037.1 hypothetical protein QA634_22425 [Methylobacterium nodulans]
MSDETREQARPARTDRPVTAEDLKGVAAVPQDGKGAENRSGADASDRQGDETDPGTG